ncbi:putative Tubulin tyrosine ligase family [Trypanosoma vivax]|uniref:Tubulin--tyrosine ligase-like protein 9 n=1 Tax=Trypanosoma vivax (strain Y486) TaxID=1055687 RepID=G0U4D5_TRYVY|nr:tubulin tyrosine ligase protein [Trypanosoma vivax]KAH8611692.1 putative Tubulin tyrosine ligase family [Trypanosoma vivax]CCC52299.1 putative tubulin tyrosine ligase protein [Trypanosoma vivax Y486]
MPSGNERRCRVGPIRFRTFLRNTVLDVMRSRGWLETDSDHSWDLFWADVCWIRDVYDHVRLDDTQRINHFRNHFELTRKDLMVKNLKRMRKTLEREGRADEASEFDFFPATFSLPQDYGLFEMEFRRQPNAIWIMKPPAKAQGKGIFLFSKISQISEWRKDYKLRQVNLNGDKVNPMYGGDQVEPYLAQRYIENPHLVGGKKYDLRVYVLVTSYAPLTVWLHRTGFARFCHQRFSLKDIDNTFIHVTNVAVQKTNPKYTPSSGCKYGLRNLREYITASGGVQVAQKLFNDIQSMILRSLHAVQRTIVNDKHCFELYGYDIMIDSELHPWLIETNASPSLSAETPADYHLKFNLLEDMFNVVDIEKRRTGDEIRVGGFDLIWKNGAVGTPVRGEGKSGIATHSFLGCANEYEIPITHMRMPPRLQQMDSSERLLT